MGHFPIKQRIIDLYVMKYLYRKYKNESKNNIDKYSKFKNNRKTILFGVPTHGNLGDHAIAYASKKFIQEMFPDRVYFEFGITEIYQNYYAIKSMINEDDIIFFTGGGNMNDIYWYEEWTRRGLVKEFKDNHIISLPVTARFSNSAFGNFEKEKSAQAYKTSKKMLFLAREQYSYDFIRSNFSKEVKLVPDIVLSLRNVNKESTRSGIAVCLRDDLEASINQSRKDEFLLKLKKMYGNIDFISTINDEPVSNKDREYVLIQKWEEFSKYNLVITDRLHGMIFCAITQTPCIVLPNNDGKIKSSYQVWLKDFSNILFFDELDFNSIGDNINDLLVEENKGENEFHKIDITFRQLEKYIVSEFIKE